MIQSTTDTYLFRLGTSAYKHARTRSRLWFGGFFLVGMSTLVLGLRLLPTYVHTFTPYLRWQDGLVALLFFITLLCLGGCLFSLRYMVALHAGYTHDILTLSKERTLTLRDLSLENLTSVFWMLHAAFWCFITALVGLLPEVLIGWTLHLPSLPLVILATAIAVLLSLAGLALSLTFGWFILMGIFGAGPLFSKLGVPQTYKLDSHIVLRIDGTVLTVIYPGKPEATIDLAALDEDDTHALLSLLEAYIIDTQPITGELESVLAFQ